MSNRDRFVSALITAYTDLFANDPEYAYSAARVTPSHLAERMAEGIPTGRANFHGEGIKRACKAVGIKQTRTGIRAFLEGQ